MALLITNNTVYHIIQMSDPHIQTEVEHQTTDKTHVNIVIEHTLMRGLLKN